MSDASARTEALRQIKDEVLGLTTSPLYAYRVNNHAVPVIGAGNHEAGIMFIGEAPGRNEAKTGVPFCGAAGKILDQLLKSVGIARADVYITNILKDRPPENRDPLPAEIELYAPFLDRQIVIIQPRVIVTLGRFAMTYILEHFGLRDMLRPISALHGRVYEGQAPYGPVKIVPLYHPAAAIYNRELLGDLQNDILMLRDILGA